MNTLAKKIFSWSSIILSIFIIVLILLLLPDEKTLGSTIKIIYIHVALVQSSLIAYGAAGIFGLIGFFKNDERIFQWEASLQKTAILFWLLYYLTSMIATYMTWGIWVEWTEPRVHIAFRVIAVSLILLVLSIWIARRIFIHIANVLMAVYVIYSTKAAINIRHPGNPIGDSDSFVYKLALYAIFILTIFIMVQVNRFIGDRFKCKAT